MAINAANTTSDHHIAPTSEILLHELQLGEQLNESVHQARRADFSLMLAMLCDDVREHSQFTLPRAEGNSVDESVDTTQRLRKHFDLPESAPLALKSIEQIKDYNQGQLIADNDLASLQLSNALSPKPLTFRDDKQYVNSVVLGNTSLTCQEKHAAEQNSPVLNKPINMNVEGWLKAVQTSLVKSSLVETIAV